jgi:pimeloyl-ACP methyl ester carboxylesterase
VCDTLVRGLPRLGSAFTLVFHDYRGSGQSGTAPRETYTFGRLADDLDELRRHLRLGPVPVLAHSMGARWHSSSRSVTPTPARGWSWWAPLPP